MRRAWLLGLLFAGGMAAATPARAAEPGTLSSSGTITSDELELQDNGERTIFSGHVVLTDPPYVLVADRMTRTRATGVVEAEGHVRGTWKGVKGDKTVATGQHGLYRAADGVTELWGKPEIRRWETAADTAPVVINAVRFIARQKEDDVWAKDQVVIRQGERAVVHCDRAKFMRADGTLHLWGARRVKVHIVDGKGYADFVGDRGWMSLEPKQARLTERVQGHVVPSPL